MRERLHVPTGAELAALRSYAEERGRRWKRDLELDWYNARLSHCAAMPERGSILHGLRNNPRFGPRGLVAFRFAKAWTVRKIDIMRCPHVIMAAEHYREDGTCKCFPKGGA